MTSSGYKNDWKKGNLFLNWVVAKCKYIASKTSKRTSNSKKLKGKRMRVQQSSESKVGWYIREKHRIQNFGTCVTATNKHRTTRFSVTETTRHPYLTAHMLYLQFVQVITRFSLLTKSRLRWGFVFKRWLLISLPFPSVYDCLCKYSGIHIRAKLSIWRSNGAYAHLQTARKVRVGVRQASQTWLVFEISFSKRW